MKYKRIAVISYHTCPLTDEKVTEIGGMNIYVLELSKELAKLGYIIDIYTRSVDENSPQIITINPNLRVIHLSAGSQSILPKKKLVKYLPNFLNSFYEFLKQEGLSYDLISAHYYLSGLIGLEIKKKYKTPLIVTFHTLALMKNLVSRSEEETEKVERIKAEIVLSQKADKIIATGMADAEYIHTLYEGSLEKIFVLTPGINHDLFKPSNKRKAKQIVGADYDHKLILFVGRIEPLKGIDTLLYALKIIVQKYSKLKICLWIIGGNKKGKNGQLPKELQRLKQIKKLLNIKTYVQFIGEKKQSELPNYYNAAELVIMPSQYESFGIAALEAMACAIPVITTDVTGISNLFNKKQDPLITSVGNPTLLSKKIMNILTDKKEHAKLSNEVLSKVKDLSWKSVAAKFSSILEG